MTDSTHGITFRRGPALSGMGGALLTLMFFVPWFSACGINVTGKDLAFGMTLDMGLMSSSTPPTYPWLAIVLVCGVAAVIAAGARLFSSALIGPGLHQLAQLVLGGLATLVLSFVLLGYVDETSGQVNVVEVQYGLYGSFLGAALIFVGGLFKESVVVPRERQLRTNLNDVITRDVNATNYLPPEPDDPTPPPIVSQGPRGWLEVQDGPAAGRSQAIAGDHFTIGRGSDAQFRLQDAAASRLHAVIRIAQGKYYLQDQQSTHGTRLNGRPILASVLKDGDAITIGDTTLVVRLE